ncbi:MAG TPA: hypothetical protein VEU07_15765 [Candidatus Acidoferrum sp.]|nr:hypothetical protein [Candidatus Acidoferrum sp.]
MLTAYVLIQSGVNVVLLAALVLLLRERTLAVRRAVTREERLEALATEFCALGQLVAGEAERTKRADPPVAEPALAPSRPAQAERAAAPRITFAPAEPIDRFKAAAAYLDEGLPIAAVVAKTAISEGEVQVLKNLRRPQKAAGVRAHRPATGRKRPLVGNA